MMSCLPPATAEGTPTAVEHQLPSAKATPTAVEDPLQAAEATPTAVEDPLPAAEATPTAVEDPLPSAEETPTAVEDLLPSAEETPFVVKDLAAEAAPAERKAKEPAEAALAKEKAKEPAEAAPSEGKTKDPAEAATPSPAEGTTPSAKEPSAGATPSAETKLPGKILSANPPARIGRPSYRHILGVPDPNGAVLFMVLLSMLYALLTPWLLWRVAGQPTAFVWTTSLLACFYFSVGVLRLSQKMRFFAVFFRVSYVVFLSVSATHFIGPNSGAAVVTLLTFYTAGMFGYAIAEYLQRVGSEEFVSVAVIPPSQSRDLQKGRDEAVCYFCFMHSVISLSLLLRMVWLVLRPASVVFLIAAKNNDNEALLVLKELSLETLSVVWPCCGFVALILQEETVVSLPTMMYKVPACVGLLYTLSTVLSVTVGEVTAVLTLWPIPMAMVGLFGYVIGMFAHYKKIRERNQPLHVSINGLSHSSA